MKTTSVMNQFANVVGHVGLLKHSNILFPIGCLLLGSGLVCAQTNWAPGQAGTIPVDSIRAGTDVDGTPLYVCRGQNVSGDEGLQPGKFRADFAGCDFSFGGFE